MAVVALMAIAFNKPLSDAAVRWQAMRSETCFCPQRGTLSATTQTAAGTTRAPPAPHAAGQRADGSVEIGRGNEAKQASKRKVWMTEGRTLNTAKLLSWPKTSSSAGSPTTTSSNLVQQV